MNQPGTLDGHCLIDCIMGQALDGMCVGLVLMNPAGKVQWLNRAAAGVLGSPPDAARGKPIGQLLKDPQFAAFWHEAADATETVMGEVSLHWPRRAELKVNATHCFGPQGASLGRALLFCDVTNERVVQVQLSQQASERLMELADSLQGHDPARPSNGLTAQELRILRLVGEGLGNQEIADSVHISLSTVRSHLKHVYAKLGLSQRSEAIRYAIQNGLV